MAAVKKIKNFVIHADMLGQGAYSTVYAGKDTITDIPVAVKVADKVRLQKKGGTPILKRELEVLKQINYKHLISFHAVVQTEHTVYIITEIAPNGSLQQLIDSEGPLPDQKSFPIAQQILLALAYMHNKKIAHRNLSPPHILLDIFNNVKLCNFGYTTSLKNCVWHTPKDVSYLAPEVIDNTGREVSPDFGDLWSFGAVVYFMSAGEPAFVPEEDPRALQQKIVRGKFQMSRNMSKNAKDLISKLLIVNYPQRLSLDLLVKHKFLHTPNLLEEYDKAIGKVKPEEVFDEEVTVLQFGESALGETQVKSVPHAAFGRSPPERSLLR